MNKIYGECKYCKYCESEIEFDAYMEEDFYTSMVGLINNTIYFCTNYDGYYEDEIYNIYFDKCSCYKSKNEKGKEDKIKSTISNGNPYYKLMKKEEDKMTEVNVKKTNNKNSTKFVDIDIGEMFVKNDELYIKVNNKGDSARKISCNNIASFEKYESVQKPKKVDIEWE
ncbi:MAG: hypothetical protein ACOCRK_07955 [bacterium]